MFNQFSKLVQNQKECNVPDFSEADLSVGLTMLEVYSISDFESCIFLSLVVHVENYGCDLKGEKIFLHLFLHMHPLLRVA